MSTSFTGKTNLQPTNQPTPTPTNTTTMTDNHLFVVLHDNHVSYCTTDGQHGSMPTGLTTHDERTRYIIDVIPHTSVEIRDDRTPPPPSIARMAMEILAACVVFSAMILLGIALLAYL